MEDLLSVADLADPLVPVCRECRDRDHGFIHLGVTDAEKGFHSALVSAELEGDGPRKLDRGTSF